VWSYDSFADDAVDGGHALLEARHRIHVPDMTEQGWNYAGLRTATGGSEYGYAFAVSVSGMDRASLEDDVQAAEGADAVAIIPWNPISFSLTSGCLGSACTGSGCLGSGCAASGCFGSACAASGCGGSGCTGSFCGGSGCAVSLCGGSGCGGSGCAGSVCGGSVCVGSVCFGSACAVSTCGASTCVGSICGGSACTASGCGGSGCLGSGCYGSACVGSACALSLCTRQSCDDDEPEAPAPKAIGQRFDGAITVPLWTADAALARDRLVVISGSD
jgi:hypothetical protein